MYSYIFKTAYNELFAVFIKVFKRKINSSEKDIYRRILDPDILYV